MKTSHKPLATSSLNSCAPTTAIFGTLGQYIDSELIGNNAFHYEDNDVDIAIKTANKNFISVELSKLFFDKKIS